MKRWQHSTEHDVMAEFLDELLPIDVRMGASYADEYEVEITQTKGGAEYRRLVHPYPTRHFTIHYTLQTADLWSRVISLYHRAYGMLAGFRVRCKDDYSTAAIGSHAPTDSAALKLSDGVYQLQKEYGKGAAALSIGYPVRAIYKPVASTVRVAIGSLEILNTPVVNWTLGTTGQITFSANKSKSVTAITKAASAVVTVGTHTLLVGESVYFSGVAGMTQINGLRGLITAIGATTITVAINSTGFSTYTSGGTVNTRPQTGETVSSGCEFDIPCRFNSRIDIQHIASDVREAGDIDIVELLNI